MAQPKFEENYYEMLRISPKATISEITSAYLVAKNAFSKDSIATYSIMGADDSAKALAELENAYMTLTNPDRRRDYDNKLAGGSEVINLNLAPITHQPLHSANSITPELQASPTVGEIAQPTEPHSGEPQTFVNEASVKSLTQIRESKGYTLADVSRITKIPTKYLKAIEEFDVKNLPVQVYTQGFLKNLAHLYRLDQKTIVLQYFEELNKRSG